MKIVVAPDSFKGSMSALQVCQAIKSGVIRAFPHAEIIEIPLADGGEGTLDALLTGAGGAQKTTIVRGPLGQPVEAHWGILPSGQAIIEMAQASGLNLVAPAKRDALRASSYGTGQLIKTALDAGCREIILGIGGSATTDGGLGALTALGLNARDDRERALEPGGASLLGLSTIDLKFLDPRLENTNFTVLCDVTNPLHGSAGAAHIYGAQKGASSQEIALLDNALEHFANVTTDFVGHDYRSHAGAGAAGGIGFGMLAFCNTQMRSGIDVILQATRFAEKIENADLVITGEGALDNQTLNGKTIAGACRAARQSQVPVIAFGGAVRLNASQMDELGLVSAFSLTDGPRDLEFCVQNGRHLLSDSVERAVRLLKIRERLKA